MNIPSHIYLRFYLSYLGLCIAFLLSDQLSNQQRVLVTIAIILLIAAPLAYLLYLYIKAEREIEQSDAIRSSKRNLRRIKNMSLRELEDDLAENENDSCCND